MDTSRNEVHDKETRNFDTDFRTWFKERNLEEMSMKPDGNDLFQAISMGIYDTADRHDEVRANVAHFITMNPDEFIQEVKPHNMEELERRIRSIQQQESGGGELSIVAASKALEVNIAVVKAPDDIVWFPQSKIFEKNIYISGQNEERYKSLSPISETGGKKRKLMQEQTPPRSKRIKIDEVAKGNTVDDKAVKSTVNSAQSNDSDDEDLKMQDRKLRKWLKTKKYRIVAMKEDNDSLYSAIAEAIKGDRDLSGVIRLEIAQYVEEHPTDFVGLVKCKSLSRLKKKVAGIRKDGNKGGMLSIIAASQLYDTNIAIIQAPDSIQWFPEGKTYQKEMLLSYHSGTQYNLILETSKKHVSTDHEHKPAQDKNLGGMATNDAKSNVEVDGAKKRKVNQEKDENFRTSLINQNFEIIQFDDHERSFFSALALAIKKDKDLQHVVRMEILQYLEAHSKDLEFQARTIKTWIGTLRGSRKRRGKPWPLLAASRCYQCNIVVLRPINRPSRYPEDMAYDNTVHLADHGDSNYSLLEVSAKRKAENDSNALNAIPAKKQKMSYEIDEKGRKIYPKNLKCQECGKRIHYLWTHLGSHFKKDELWYWKCNYCPTSKCSKQALENHIRQMHPYVVLHQCDICMKRCETYTNLMEHRRVNHKEKFKYLCEICGKTFQRQPIFWTHLKTVHSTKKTYPCKQCPKLFKDYGTLWNHMQLHKTPNMAHQCPYCKKEYQDWPAFKLHKKWHEGKLPEKCSKCSLRFVSPKILNAHMRIHKEKQFSCTYCGLRVATMKSLIGHRRRHTGEKPFICLQCGKQFHYAKYLKRHVDCIHEDPQTKKRCTCRLCLVDCVNYSTWYFHWIVHHSGLIGKRNSAVQRLVRSFNMDCVILKEDKEYEHFLDCIRRGSMYKCCAITFESRFFAKQHLINHHWNKASLFHAFNEKEMFQNLGQSKSEIRSKLLKIYELSKKLFPLFDNLRRVYILALVPKNRDKNIPLMEYLRDKRNPFFIDIGKQSYCFTTAVSKHHYSRNKKVATHYIVDSDEYEVCHIAEIWIDKLNDGKGLERLNRMEAYFILKLHAFCMLTGQDRMIQKLEFAPLRNKIEDEDLEAMVADIDRCDGNLFDMENFRPQFFKNVCIPTNCLTENDRKILLCEICGHESLSPFHAKLHGIECKKRKKITLSPGEKVLNTNPRNITDLRRRINDVPLVNKFSVYGMTGSEDDVVVEDYVGKSAGTMKVSEYHRVKGIPSALKKMHEKGLELKQAINIPCDSFGNMNATETKIILSAAIRRNLFSNMGSVNVNALFQMYNLAFIMSIPELDEVINFGCSGETIFNPKNRPTFMEKLEIVDELYII